MKVLIGSKAIKYWFPDFPREPKDIDYACDTEQISGRQYNIENLYNPIICKYIGDIYPKIADPNTLYKQQDSILHTMEQIGMRIGPMFLLKKKLLLFMNKIKLTPLAKIELKRINKLFKENDEAYDYLSKNDLLITDAQLYVGSAYITNKFKNFDDWCKMTGEIEYVESYLKKHPNAVKTKIRRMIKKGFVIIE